MPVGIAIGFAAPSKTLKASAVMPEGTSILQAEQILNPRVAAFLELGCIFSWVGPLTASMPTSGLLTENIPPV